MLAQELKFTYEDYCLFPDDGRRHEIIDGEHYMAPAPTTTHQRVSGRLYRLLAAFVESQGLGEAFSAPVDVILSPTDIVQPDILYISRDRQGIITEKNIQGAPDLVVEVLSETTERTDRGIKMKLYARYGVREYWLVDPETREVEFYRLGKAGLELYGRCQEKEFESEILPGLRVSPVEIFL